MVLQNPKSVQIEWFFSLPPAAVWSGWTDEAMVRRWFGSDPAGRVLSAQLDVRVGGRFEVRFMDSTGAEHVCRGVYVEVKPASKLSFSWNWRSEPGIETLVTVELTPKGTGTQMQFEHGRLIETSLHDYAAGWQRTFEKLAGVLLSK
ncbi:MAG: SRPBCC domain-containing protein [Opitutus sp.]